MNALSLVKIENNELVTSSLLIADGVAREHETVIRLIDENSDDLEEFGHLRFEIGAGYNNAKVRSALLNEQQATLLITYMRNSAVVKEFKKRLVSEFFRMRDELNKPKQQFAIPQTYAEALRLAAEQAEKLAIAAPKAQVYDRVIERSMLLTATQVGQKIGMSAIILNRHLTELRVYNRAVKRGKVFQQWFIDNGFGEMKLTAEGHSQPLFTNAGEMWVIERLTSEGIE